MRQAGRYMKEFRAYSDKYPFRQRSETPEIAIELSLQPWRAYKTDGVIFFSDILTPLPALGVEFDVIKGTGPVIAGTPSSNPWQDSTGSKFSLPTVCLVQYRCSACVCLASCPVLACPIYMVPQHDVACRSPD